MSFVLKIVPAALLKDFKKAIDFDPLLVLKRKEKEKLPFDYFKFYRSVSSVYSSKIEGESVEMDSYMKHKFLQVAYEPDYTKRADDLFDAYVFMENNPLNATNVLEAHKILSNNLLASNQRGIIRSNPMFVLNEADRIEYVACEPIKVNIEWEMLFEDIDTLVKANLSKIEVFFFAAMVHLVFLKIHPLQDGNGRTARLIEKWFLQTYFGKSITALELEKNYFQHKQAYYDNIRLLGIEYETLDYTKSLPFTLMTINSLKNNYPPT